MCRSWALIVLAMATGGCGSTRVARVAGAAEEPFPIEEYVQHRHVTDGRITEIITEMTPRLKAGSAEENRRAMKEIAAFIREHLGPHAEQVETLYTFADREAGPRYTETMRWEHQDLGSSMRFLESLAGAREPDVQMFRTQLNAFLSRMRWHMQKETYTIGAFVVDNELERQRQVEKQRVAAKDSGK
jgi:hemerythrin-like domain-containing protein